MLCDELKKYRDENKLTQVELAAKLYVSRSAVAKWEQGKGIPNKDTMQDVSRLLNISFDKLLDDDTTYGVIDNIKSSSKKQLVSLIMCIIILVGIFFSFTMFIVVDNSPIDVVTSFDGKYTLKVYDYVKDDKFPFKKEKGFHYKYYYEGEFINSTRILENCEYAGIYFSPSSRFFITSYYYYDDNNVKKLYHESTDLQYNSGSNLQYYITSGIKIYYKNDSLDTDNVNLKLICLSNDADMVLMQYSFYNNNELINGYLWYDLLNREALGITEIPNIN